MRFESVGRSVGNAVLSRLGRAASRVSEETPLPVDVLEGEDEYLVVFDVPGVEPGDVQVGYVDGAVEVRLDRFRDPHPGFEMRYPGRALALDGRADLPDDADVDADAARAELTNGTLRVFLPKV
ncbi:Hsp20 family protein [Salarchaeum sp. JOR-1]|uniref:Hsp20 family protein n=1 Tax=Salarchaeum sp. JOR-1 TaxID=2599399 RepID=UPI001198C70A|nr:Hsp20 family protein [Salarchaeum sp. JOR-1]QDX39784.1 Hsp20 family protein [Salarchaeum sp. JOR-1]